MTERCDGCHFFRGTMDGTGRCRNGPPKMWGEIVNIDAIKAMGIPASIATRKHDEAVWPLVQASAWCGHFQPATPVAEMTIDDARAWFLKPKGISPESLQRRISKQFGHDNFSIDDHGDVWNGYDEYWLDADELIKLCKKVQPHG